MSVKENFKFEKGNPYLTGTNLIDGGVNFTVSIPNVNTCSLEIYKKGEKEVYQEIKLDKSYRTGSVFSVYIKDFDYKKYEYNYKYANETMLDPYATIINGRDTWAKAMSKSEKKLVRSGFGFDDFDWGNDKNPNTDYSESIFYKVHLKGFTSDITSNVSKKGTFEGFTEKIPYLKELGITAVIFMPIYEFDEILINEYVISPQEPEYMEYRELSNKRKSIIDGEDTREVKFEKMRSLENVVPFKVNYWGFSDNNNYFAPKRSYAYNKDEAVYELKNMIKQLHKAGIEVIMNMHFTRNVNTRLITDCFLHWVKNYHVDGFVYNNNVVPVSSISTEPLLADVKLITNYFDIDGIYGSEYVPNKKNLAELNDGFMVDAKKYIKGDERQVLSFTKRFMKNPQKYATINYVTNYYGFTLRDLYSYDVKHNEDNGEFNKDGTEYNYSWNCGHEGKTKKVKVLKLRKKMMKNMLAVMLLSQGTPMLLAGDEMCNTQNGNNNAYCQDNDITWLKWRFNETSMEIYDFVKTLIRIRKNHPILHMKNELRVMDYLSKGCPDISFHGLKNWYPDFSNYSRVVGIMISGDYLEVEKKGKIDNYFYIACNMHWESHEYNLPELKDDLEWRLLIDTSIEKYKCNERLGKKLSDPNKYQVADRSVVVFMSGQKGDSSLK